MTQKAFALLGERRAAFPPVTETQMGLDAAKLMKICPICQTSNDADAKFCNSCGNPLLPAQSGASVARTDPSKMNVLVLSASQSRQAVLASSPDVLESEISYLFVLYNRVYGLHYCFLGGASKGNDPYEVACAQVDQAALAILRVDEKFLSSPSCLDVSECLVERYQQGEPVRIFPLLKSKSLSISLTPFSAFGTLTLQEPEALATGILWASVYLACNNEYQGEMSLYGWLLQRLVFKGEARTEKFVVGSCVLAWTESSWHLQKFTLYNGQHFVDTFTFKKITDPDVGRLSTALGAVDGRPHFVKGIAL